MVIAEVLESRLIARLRPWLLEEPGVQVKLGFWRSVVTLRNLAVDPSVLNSLIEGSTGVVFKSARIEEARFQVCLWSSTFLDVEVPEVHVVLAQRESNDGVHLVPKKDNTARELREKLSSLDPDGVVIDDIIRGYLSAVSSQNQFMTALQNALLQRIRLQFHELCFQLDLVGEYYSGLLKAKEITLDSRLATRTSLLSGLLGALLFHDKSSCIGISCICLEFGLKDNDIFKCLASSTNVSVHMEVISHKTQGVVICFPQAEFVFSPVEIPVVVIILGMLSSQGLKSIRSGKDLWKLTARKLASHPQVSLYRLFSNALIWIRYVRAYEVLLSAVGYCDNQWISKLYAGRMPKKRQYFDYAFHKVKMIDEMELLLTPEAIARARRIARHRALLHHCKVEHENHFFINYMWIFFVLIRFSWKFILLFFYSVLHLLLFIWRSLCFYNDTETHSARLNIASEGYSLQGLAINVDELQITVHPTKILHATRNLEQHSDIVLSNVNFLSFCLVINSISFIQKEDRVAQSIFLAIGEFRVHAISSSGAPHTGSYSKVGDAPFEETSEIGDDLQIIMWSEPALLSQIKEVKSGAQTFCSTPWILILESCLGDLKSYWATNCNKSKENCRIIKHPFALCDVKKIFAVPYAEASEQGILKCSWIVGKLDVDLDSSSLISIAMLVKQAHHYINRSERSQFSSDSSILTQKTSISFEDQLMSYTSEMKKVLLNIIPKRNIEIGAIMAGINIKILLEKEKLQRTKSHSCLIVDIDEFEIAIWPATNNVMLNLNPGPGKKAAAPDYLWLKEPRIVDLTEAYQNHSFSFNERISQNAFLSLRSLRASFEDLEESCQCCILGPLSVTVQCSTCRDHIFSYWTTANALSMALSGVTVGPTALSYLDELCNLSQFYESVRSVLLVDTVNLADIDYHDQLGRECVTSTTRDVTGITASWQLDNSFVLENTKFTVDMSLIFEDLNIVFSNISKDVIMGKTIPVVNVDDNGSNGGHKAVKFPDRGISVFVQKSSIQVSSDQENLKFLVDFSRIDSLIIDNKNEKRACIDLLQVRNNEHQSFEWLYRFSVPACTLCLRADLNDSALPVCIMKGLKFPPHLTLVDKGSEPQSDDSVDEIFTEITHNTPSRGRMIFDIEISEIGMSNYQQKNFPIQSRQPIRLRLVISASGESHTISCEVKGGYIFIETSALAAYIKCFREYSLFLSGIMLQSHLSKQFLRSKNAAHVSDSISSENNCYGTVEGVTFEEELSPVLRKLQLLNSLSIAIYHWSFTFGVIDETGEINELEIDADANLELTNFGRKFLVDITHLTILSRLPRRNSKDQARRTPSPRFYSSKESDTFYNGAGGDRSLHTIGDGHSGPFSSEISPDNKIIRLPTVYHNSYLLKNLTSSVWFERNDLEVGSQQPQNFWVGNGSVSGLDVTVALSEIQMLLAFGASLSEISTSKAVPGMYGLTDHRSRSSENVMPDEGSIVAIQDIHQHMYISVQAAGAKYSLVGVLHYSLAGEKALFRVKYHKQKSWRSSALQFLFISLYAEKNSGKPHYLSFRPGSGFVELSDSDSVRSALWETFPYKFTGDKDGNELQFYDDHSEKAFHLVNAKSSYAVAFVDENLEFVKRPGNPFKVKVFQETLLMPFDGRLSFPNPSTYDTHETNSYNFGDSFILAEMCRENKQVELFTITVDKVTLTILHDFSDADHRIPLIRGCIDAFHITGQILSSKFRFVNSFKVGICCFDTQRNQWRNIISPVDSCMYLRSRAASQISPLRFFLRLKQVDISLDELSLDVLLFLVGKLNIAGPYSMRSLIFFNCCKVENYTGLSLFCQFADEEEISISSKQSTSIFLSRAMLDHELSTKDILVSLRLSEPGSFSTSPIEVSLSKSCLLVWRTRVISHQDSRRFPGPFIVIEILKDTEKGLSLVVSPLLRIHNESGFPMKLQFRRPSETESESASVVLRDGDTIDDSRAVFDALKYSGDLRKALMSLGVGNFLLSIRPEFSDKVTKSPSVEWSEELKGGKAVRVSGIFDKLNYRFKKAFGFKSMTSSFNLLHCALTVEGICVGGVYFLMQIIGRDVPVMPPHNVGDVADSKTSPVAFQVQKEIFIFPTIRVFNLLQTEVVVLLTENHPDLCKSGDYNNFGKQMALLSGSAACLYVNPEIIYFTVTLVAFGSRCKPVDSAEWIKKLHKQKKEINYFDIDLDFCGGKYFASMRLSRGDKGILEAPIFTSYILENITELPLFCFAHAQKNISRVEAVTNTSHIPPELGVFLPCQSSRSWFHKSNVLHLKLLEMKASEALLDLDAISGTTEVSLEYQNEAGFSYIAKMGVSLVPCDPKALLPSQKVRFSPRYVISNESKISIIVRQCYLEEDIGGVSTIESNHRVALYMRKNVNKNKEISVFDSILRKHRSVTDDSPFFIQFGLKEIQSSWSGPICIASLGRFFLKFKIVEKSPTSPKLTRAGNESQMTKLAEVYIAEEGSSLVLHFHMPPNLSLPYRLENFLRNTAILYHQKDSTTPEIIQPGNLIQYVWDDLTLPHKLVVQVTGINVLREINIDKVRSWKPILKTRHINGLQLHLPLENKSAGQRDNVDSHGFEALKYGYEVYTDGQTRVLRICEYPDSYKEEKMLEPRANIQLRVAFLAVNLLERCRQDDSIKEFPTLSSIIMARLVDIVIDASVTDRCKYTCLKVESINVDEKWDGAPFSSMIRRSQLNDSANNDPTLYFVFYLKSRRSSVKQVEYCSIVLQPIDLNLDEETLMRLLKFWRTSMSDSGSQGRFYYFKHFEIHPIKIRASFLPGDQFMSYSSAQETLRSLLHNVVKVPSIRNALVELNGVLLTHALVTTRELGIKCAQHYSWYIIRAIYKAKGSPLLPPAFASIFDDSASSSLDIFFDPSDGSINLPGVTLGMFKFISSCIGSKGFSGTKRYFGDLGKTVKRAGSNALFAAITEISDSVLLGAETNGFNGLIIGFHQGILKLAMEPSRIGAAVMEGGPDRRINLDRSIGTDEQYIEGYLQAMLDVMYKQEYLRVKVNDNQVILKNLPPNTALINEIVEQVRSFLISKALLRGEASATRLIHRWRGESEWRLGPTMLTLCEHLFVSFAIRMLRGQASKLTVGIRLRKRQQSGEEGKASVLKQVGNFGRFWFIGRFVLSGVVAYVDGRLCRHIPNPIARRIVSGFLLSFLEQKDGE